MPAITAAMLAAGQDLSEPRVSPDATAVVAVVAWHGRAALVRFPLDGGPSELITSEPAPRSGRPFGGGQWDWCPDGEAVVLASGGDLWWQPMTGGPARRLTAQPPGAPAQAPAVSPDGTAVAYVVDQHHIERLDLVGASPTSRTLGDGVGFTFAFDPAWSPDGRHVAWHAWAPPAMPWDTSTIVVADAVTGDVVARHGGTGVATQQPRFSPDGRLAHLADRTGHLVVHVVDRDGSRPLRDEPFEHGTAAWGLGQRSWCWSPDGTSIAFCRNEAGHGRLCVADVATGAVTELGKGWHGGLDWRADTLVAVRSGARTPTELVTYHLPSARPGVATRRVLARGPVAGFDAAGLVEPELLDWTADDGLTLHGRLYVPDDGGDGRMIVWVHGGPTDQWAVTWNARIAAWVSRGWRVLVPDHRGSTGWGRQFQQALNGRWGEADADDVAAGVRAALERGRTRPGAVVGMGGSAGGFTVLNLVRRHPGLLAGAVVAYPVSDLAALDDTTHRFEAHANATLVGPRPRFEDRYRTRSPRAGAAALRVPLLILHGSDDPVVPVAHSRALADAVNDAGGSATLVVYDGEGHGWSRPATAADELARAEAFLATVVDRPRERPPD